MELAVPGSLLAVLAYVVHIFGFVLAVVGWAQQGVYLLVVSHLLMLFGMGMLFVGLSGYGRLGAAFVLLSSVLSIYTRFTVFIFMSPASFYTVLAPAGLLLLWVETAKRRGALAKSLSILLLASFVSTTLALVGYVLGVGIVPALPLAYLLEGPVGQVAVAPAR